MKVLPYTSVPNMFPAACLVTVNATVFFGPKVQLVALMALMVGCARHIALNQSINARLLFVYLFTFIVLGFLEQGNTSGFTRSAKLLLFALLSMITLRSPVSSDFTALVALRAFFGLCMVNLLYAVGTGGEIFRASHFIEYSINSSYTIALLCYLARPRLKVYDRVFAWLFVIQMGSTTGMFVLILSELVGRKFSPKVLIASAVMAPFAFIALAGLMEIRGKEVSLEYLMNSDRAVLLSTFFTTLTPNFSLIDWMTGFGVGTPLHAYTPDDIHFANYLKRLGDGEIFAFCLHIEGIRVLTDFGLIGIFLIGIQLSRNCPPGLLFLVCVCMLTNTFVYNSSGALIASTIFNQVAMRSSKSRSAQLKPKYANATLAYR